MTKKMVESLLKYGGSEINLLEYFNNKIPMAEMTRSPLGEYDFITPYNKSGKEMVNFKF
jgi:hypothetical protein